MPAIAFPSWWHAARNNMEIDKLYQKVYTAMPCREEMKKLVKDFEPLSSRYFCQMYRDPLLLSYLSLCEGVLEACSEDPIMIFPSVAVNTLDEEKFIDKTNLLLSVIDDVKDLNLDSLKEVSDKVLSYTNFSTDNFHPMLADAFSSSVGCFVTKVKAAEVVGDWLIESCYKGDKIYAKELSNYIDELIEDQERSVEFMTNLVFDEDYEKAVETKLGNIVDLPNEFIFAAAKCLESMYNNLTSFKFDNLIIAKPNNKDKEQIDVKTKSDYYCKNVLKEAINKLRRM